MELDLARNESHKKMKQIVQKKLLIESKLSEAEQVVKETNREIDMQEREYMQAEEIDSTTSTYDSAPSAMLYRTPTATCNFAQNRLLLSKLYSEKKNSTAVASAASTTLRQNELVQAHTNSSSLFAQTLRVTEANRICSTLGLEYEFKRYEIAENKAYVPTVSVVDRRLGLVTLWNLDTFENRLGLLREIYSKHAEENEDRMNTANSTINTSSESIFLTDSMDEWQKLSAFSESEAFSPRV